VGQEQLQALLSTMFHFFCQQVDIMFTKDGIHTLVDVVIVDPTQAYLLCQSHTT